MILSVDYPLLSLLNISSIALGITLCYASYLDVKNRRVPIKTWYPMLVISIPLVLFLYVSLALTDVWLVFRYLAIVGIFCCFFYFFAFFNLFGGADAMALIFIAAALPLFPLRPYFGYPPLYFFPFTVLTNAVILNLFTPIGIFVLNIRKKNFAPIQYMFFGFPIPSDKIDSYFGYIMEEITDVNGKISRRFLPIHESLRRMIHGEERFYTKNIKEHPEKYAREREIFKKAGYVWISYGVPFIVPITVGFFVALFAGDILYTIMVSI